MFFFFTSRCWPAWSQALLKWTIKNLYRYKAFWDNYTMKEKDKTVSLKPDVGSINLSWVIVTFILPWICHQVIHNAEIQTEVQPEAVPVETPTPTEVLDLQAQLQDTLRALQQQQQDAAYILDDDKVHHKTNPYEAQKKM